MSKIAQIDGRSAAVAWSPLATHADVLAIGTKDSGGIGFAETGGELELYDLDLSMKQSRGGPICLGHVHTESRFASLGWSVPTSLSSKYPLGVIAGGMENGVVHVWDAEALVKSSSSSSSSSDPSSSSSAAVIVSFTQHASGPVKSLHFNSLVPSLLATGGSDGAVFIVDLSKHNDVPLTPNADPSQQQRSAIMALAWNTEVAHILASAASDGTVAIWDTQARKRWCELHCGNEAVTAVNWNPTQGMQLLTASYDDRSPIIKLWDLRSSTSMPLATLAGHTKGILGMAWCPHDEHLLMSCGKDSRTILWDLYSMQPIGDLPNDPLDGQDQASAGNHNSMFGLASSTHSRYDVQWSPIKRGVVSTCALDRKVQAHSVLGLASSSGRPPKWMTPKSSVSFGFGGCIVSCGPTDREIRLRTVVEDPSTVEVSQAFEICMDPTNINAYCHEQAEKSKTTHEKRLWKFMQIIFEENAREQLLQVLGYDRTSIALNATSAVGGTPNGGIDKSSHGKTETMSADTLKLVQDALVVGDFDSAVESCFSAGNLADALILASCGGADLWTKTREKFVGTQASGRPYLSIVAALVKDDLESYVQNSDLSKWQETLAVLSTFSKSDAFPTYCTALGDRLSLSGDEASAVLCYVFSLDLEKAVKYWRAEYEGGPKSFDHLHDFVRKVSVILHAVGSTSSLTDGDTKLFFQYSTKLAQEGLLVSAAKYCVDESDGAKKLKDRLYRSRASERCFAAMGGRAPEFPYDLSSFQQSRAHKKSAQNTRRDYGRQASTNSSISTNYNQEALTLQQTMAPSVDSSNALPAGWVELQDPASGQTYYANQSTGETTWDRPQPPQNQSRRAVSQVPIMTPVQEHQHQAQAQSQSSTGSTHSRNTKLASKYGDGFVSSASNPELASQYGNVGTSNPYTTTARPGPAKAGSAGTPAKAPVSGNLDTMPELPAEYQVIPDTLLGLTTALKGGQLTAADRRQVTEAEKAIAIFSKRLAWGEISEEVVGKMQSLVSSLSGYDWSGAVSIQTALVSSEWRDHKDWLKGIKALVQLAAKLYGGR